MTRVLLDTSAYSGFMRGHAAIKHALQQADEIYFSPIVLGELLAGFRRGRNRARNERELQTFLSSPRVRGVGLDEETAERYAVIVEGLWKAGTPIPTNDIWIAASAMQYGLSILTTDAHYQRAAQVIVHLFEPS
ncbi:MAG: type II toxin-antitoxin system VapC family toxin [Candidatus Rokubacteria bacterium]|nr:type II toxin-antitoxin system VapC family toxin [Candidatus Rokubacteria bacterium]